VGYNALLSAWSGKVKHNLVRPTTVIRGWGEEELDTFGGYLDDEGSRVIWARDFEAVIHVMPHSEYPSGLAPLCKAYTDYAKVCVTFFIIVVVAFCACTYQITCINYPCDRHMQVATIWEKSPTSKHPFPFPT